MKNVLINLTCRKVKTGSLCGVVALKGYSEQTFAERRAKFETDPEFACRWLRSRKSIVSGSSGNNDSSVGLIARSWESFWGDVKQNSPEVLKFMQ